jgi:hypothetical protein
VPTARSSALSFRQKREEREMTEERTLARPLRLPDATSFGELFEFLADWHSGSGASREARLSPPVSVTIDCWSAKAPRTVEIELGPLCVLQLISGRRSIAVRPLGATVEAVRPFLLGDQNEAITFRIIEHRETGRALVIAESSLILQNVWIAYIDPATIPGEESQQ